MEVEHAELFVSFLRRCLKTPPEDPDAYLERLIIHWGETGRETFSLGAEETALRRAGNHRLFRVQPVFYPPGRAGDPRGGLERGL